MLECTKIYSQLRTHKINGTRYLILVIARTGEQIVTMDLADEKKIPRYTKTYGYLCDHF
jgi:hypothetical protein